MLKLVRYLKSSGATLLVVIALLAVQAYCDLSLPTYTASIVDVGIQQGGIDHVAPTQMREKTLQDLLLFLDDETGFVLLCEAPLFRLRTALLETLPVDDARLTPPDGLLY